MSRGILKTVAVLALVPIVALTCSQSGKSSSDRLSRGDEAPRFSLPMLDGSREVVSAKEIHNAHATVLIFWSMACPSCREALLECQQVYDAFGHQAAVFYGINFDIENIQGVRAFIKGENITIPHLWDRGQRTTKEYKALDYTFSVFVIDREGKVVLAQYDHPPDLARVLTETLRKTLPDGGQK
jgi:peroxiredoxin